MNISLIDLIFLRGGYNSTVVTIGVALLGVAAGFIGVFAFVRKRALVSDALAHATLPGIGLAYILMLSLGITTYKLPILMMGAGITGLLAMICISLLSKYTRLKEDSNIGIVLSVFFGFGIVLLSIIQSLGGGSGGGINHFIFGQAAAMGSSDAIFNGCIASLSLVFSLLLLKEFRLVCFDSDYAKVQGWPVFFIDIAMLIAVTLITVVGIQSVGIILIVSFLIIPPVSARLVTHSLKKMIFISAFIGGAAGYLGACISALYPNAPTGAVIVLLLGGIFTAVLIFMPKRGVVARSFSFIERRLRIGRDHLLRNLIFSEKMNFTKISELRDMLHSGLGLSKFYNYLVLLICFIDGSIKYKKGHIILSKSGEVSAKLIARNHRLWQIYLNTCVDIKQSHLDYSVDLVEHVLTPEIIRLLETQLSDTENLSYLTIKDGN